MKKRMLIVGAGISGLSTAYYALMNGYDTEIFEMHNIPGGLCTAWTRKGYTFDTSMHFLMSSRKGPFKKIWDELGITKDQKFHYHERISYIEGEGCKLDFCLDRQKLEKQMLDISPQDAELIKEFCDMVFGKSPLSEMPVEPIEVMGFFPKVKMILSMMAFFRKYRKIARVSLQDFTARFRDPFLAKAIRYSIDTPGWPMPEFPFMYTMGMAQSSVLDSGYPLGGRHLIQILCKKDNVAFRSALK